MDADPRDDQVLKVVGERIRLARLARRWSQDKLAHKSGMRHQSLVSEIELGRSARLVAYIRLARALELPPEQLFAGLDEDR